MCEYCEGENKLYQESTYAKLYVVNCGKRKGLMVEPTQNYCPPHATCSARGMAKRSVFLIDYCPACGRKLNGDKALTLTNAHDALENQREC